MKVLGDAQVVVVFPEGTITTDPELKPMAGRTGAARLALASGAPNPGGVVGDSEPVAEGLCETLVAASTGGPRASRRAGDAVDEDRLTAGLAASVVPDRGADLIFWLRGSCPRCRIEGAPVEEVCRGARSRSSARGRGTAVAALVTNKNRDQTILWARRAELAETINLYHENPEYLRHRASRGPAGHQRSRGGSGPSRDGRDGRTVPRFSGCPSRSVFGGSPHRVLCQPHQGPRGRYQEADVRSIRR